MDKRRLLAIAIFLVITVLVGYAIYFVFFKKAGPDTTTSLPTSTSAGDQFPSIGEGKITNDNTTSQPGTLPISNVISGITDNTGTTGTTDSLSQDSIARITTKTTSNVSADALSGAKFYNNDDGKFYRVSAEGTIKQLSDEVFFNVSNVTWSPTREESIIEYPDGANIYYNFDTGEQITLPKHWTDFDFSDDGSEIAAKSIGLDGSNRWLVTSDPKGRDIKLIESLGDNADKVIVDWSPNRQVVALSRTGEVLGGQREEVLLIGLNGENFPSITVEGRGLETEWSPNGEKLLHSVYNTSSDYKPELWIVDATPDTAGNNRKPLGVNTWASKCTMADERFVYCGVPESLDSGAGFAPNIADTTADDIYRIDTVTGIKTVIPTTDYHTVDSMFMSDDGTTLYFTDKNQDGIFQVKIK